jgi:hypothetical protein
VAAAQPQRGLQRACRNGGETHDARRAGARSAGGAPRADAARCCRQRQEHLWRQRPAGAGAGLAGPRRGTRRPRRPVAPRRAAADPRRPAPLRRAAPRRCGGGTRRRPLGFHRPRSRRQRLRPVARDEEVRAAGRPRPRRADPARRPRRMRQRRQPAARRRRRQGVDAERWRALPLPVHRPPLRLARRRRPGAGRLRARRFRGRADRALHPRLVRDPRPAPVAAARRRRMQVRRPAHRPRAPGPQTAGAARCC